MMATVDMPTCLNVALISGFPAEQRGKMLVQGAVFLRAHALARSFNQPVSARWHIHTAASNAQTASVF